MSETAQSERSRWMWDDEDGNLYMLGHWPAEEFIGAAREFWQWTTGGDEGWEEHYGDLAPEYVEHVWWRPLDPSLTWDTAEEAPGEWLDHDAERATPITRYWP